MVGNGQQPVALDSVTDEMIRAGLDVFWAHDPAGDFSETTVAEIFCAMLRAQRQSPSQDRSRHQECRQSIRVSP